MSRMLALALVVQWALIGCGGSSSGNGGEEGLVEEGGEVGEAGEAGEAGETGEACDAVDLSDSPAIHGWIYEDLGEPDVSTHVAGFDASVDVPIPQMNVALLSQDGEETTATCLDGGFAFADVGLGARIIAPHWPEGTICNSRNCPKHIIQAIREGSVKIVTFGDSVPVVGSAQTFPVHLGERINAFAPTNSVNVAVGGTTSPQWLPGTSLFNNTLIPEIVDADMVIASIGGNDLLEYANNALAGGGGLNAAIDGASAKVQEIMDNVLQTFAEIRKTNPDVDLVYCLYPNYAESKIWGDMLNVFPGVQDLVVTLISDALDQVRAEIDPAEDIVLVDFFAALDGTLLDDYLYDSLHFNDIGHVFYAEEIFRTIGGVVVQPLTQFEATYGVHSAP